jgi:hypothetical protein
MIASISEALSFGAQRGAPPRLLMHLQLVVEASEQLVLGYQKIGIPFDRDRIVLGAALHDIGKIFFQEELDGPGTRHEEAGEALLLKHAVQPPVARYCVTHAAWHLAGVSFEKRSVALADKLWKGKREAELELLVIDEAALKLGKDRWQLFAPLDSLFEGIASDGPSRLRRSQAAHRSALAGGYREF